MRTMPTPDGISPEFHQWLTTAESHLVTAMDAHADDWQDILANSFEIMEEYWDGQRLLTVEVLLAKIVILYDRELRLGDRGSFHDDWGNNEWSGDPDFSAQVWIDEAGY
jgi:hypothetical protein